uniref:Uncharacterized protein n=1 Tax=Ananas comosus var. bracteatus TaxID=296719 RepID=A0A6V7P965_ANACO|nr:unnamed protein product [Ananas comosus var. bracteatus]
MVTKLKKGKRHQGKRGRQWSMSAASASWSMWMKPVARIPRRRPWRGRRSRSSCSGGSAAFARRQRDRHAHHPRHQDCHHRRQLQPQRCRVVAHPSSSSAAVSGIAMPTIPATRIAAIATSFSRSAAASSGYPSSSSVVPPQLPTRGLGGGGRHPRPWSGRR